MSKAELREVAAPSTSSTINAGEVFLSEGTLGLRSVHHHVRAGHRPSRESARGRGWSGCIVGEIALFAGVNLTAPVTADTDLGPSSGHRLIANQRRCHLGALYCARDWRYLLEQSLRGCRVVTTSMHRRPRLPRWATEATWPLEAAASGLVPFLTSRIARGKGEPVLVLPGFTADDASTRRLRGILDKHGYTSSGWGLGRNDGLSHETLDGVRTRIDDMSRSSGQKVSLVGWSLGGVAARLIARQRPHLIRQVITLASPYRMFGDTHARTDAPSMRQLTMPATSIYTRSDGVVHWAHCIDETEHIAANPRAENVEVRGTHLGMGVNPAVALVVLDRLAQPEDGWTPFERPIALASWYPRSSSGPSHQN